MCHVGRRAALHAAGIFCFPLSVPFSGVPIEESCRERKGDGTLAFPHMTWNLTFLLSNVPEALSLFTFYLLFHSTSNVPRGPLVSRLPSMKNPYTSSQTSAYSKNY